MRDSVIPSRTPPNIRSASGGGPGMKGRRDAVSTVAMMTVRSSRSTARAASCRFQRMVSPRTSATSWSPFALRLMGDRVVAASGALSNSAQHS